MKFFVTGVGGQLGHDVMNELLKRGHEGAGSDIQETYSGVADGSAVTKAPYMALDITDKEYINHRDDLMLLDVFADKRCTGMNFDRPEFERLLKALQERKIDCIVVKDFSRFDRADEPAGEHFRKAERRKSDGVGEPHEKSGKSCRGNRKGRIDLHI